MKATALIFSKDDTDQAIELASAIRGDFDETVVMDASGKRGKAYLKEGKRRLGLDRMRIFDVIALGFREPLMMYALTKCRNEWVIAFNTDEKPSESLVRDMHKLISRKGNDAYSIPIYSVHGPKSRTFVSSQIRLFKKGKIHFRGMLHEQPIVRGTFLELSDGYYINHMTTGKSHTTKVGYAELERFQRYTYRDYNKNMLEMYDRARKALLSRQEGNRAGEEAHARGPSALPGARAEITGPGGEQLRLLHVDARKGRRPPDKEEENQGCDRGVPRSRKVLGEDEGVEGRRDRR